MIRTDGGWQWREWVLRSSLWNWGSDVILVLHYGDLTDSSNLTRIVQEVQPDEVYNLGAQSHVAVSFESPEYTADVDTLGTLRDWGHAKDYVRMQWMMLQQETPEDFVIATGRQHSVRDFVRMSARCLGVTLRFEGKGIDEIGVVERVEGPDAPALKPGDTIVRVDPRYFRPAEVETLLGDPTKAREKLGWTPAVTLEELCAEMVAEDLNLAKRCALLQQCGFTMPTPRE